MGMSAHQKGDSDVNRSQIKQLKINDATRLKVKLSNLKLLPPQYQLSYIHNNRSACSLGAVKHHSCIQRKAHTLQLAMHSANLHGTIIVFHTCNHTSVPHTTSHTTYHSNLQYYTRKEHNLLTACDFNNLLSTCRGSDVAPFPRLWNTPYVLSTILIMRVFKVRLAS